MAGESVKQAIEILVKLGVDKETVRNFAGEFSKVQALIKAANDEAKRDSNERIQLSKQQTAIEIQGSKERIAVLQQSNKMTLALMKMETDAAKSAAKERENAEKAEIKQRQDATRQAEQLAKQKADTEKRYLREVEREQQDAIRAEIAAQKKAAQEEEALLSKQRQYERAQPLAAARGFTSLGMGTWALPGSMQDQSFMADNILLGAGALSQMQAQIDGMRESAAAAGVGLSGMVLSMVPIIAASAAITIGLKAMQDHLERVTKAEQELVNARKTAADAAAQAVGKERGMSMRQLRRNEDDTERQIKIYGNMRATTLERVFDLQKKIQDLDAKGIFIGAEGVLKRQEYVAQLDVEKKAAQDAQAALDKLSATQRVNIEILEPQVLLWDRLNKVMEDAQREGDTATKLTKLSRSDSTKDVRDFIQANDDQINALEVTRRQMRKYLEQIDPASDQGQELTRAIAENAKQQDELRKQNDEATKSIMPLVHQREMEKFIVDQQTRAFERHTKQAEADVKALEQATDKAAQYQGQIDDERAKRGKQVESQLQDDLIRDQREGVVKDYQRRIDQAREQERLADNAKKRQKIIDDAARAEIKADQDLQEKFKDIDAKYKNRVDDINRNFMEKSLDELDKFHKAAREKDDEYYKKRNRLIEDAQDKLTVLAAERDVAGFILEQREFEKKLRRLDEDHKTEADLDSQHYQDRLKELQDSRDKELAASAADYELQRIQTQEHYDLDKAQRQAALDERLRMEDENNKVRLSRADALEKELQAKREQWQREDEARRRAQEEADYVDRMKRLQKFYDDQKAIIDSLMRNVYGNIPASVARAGADAADAYISKKFGEFVDAPGTYKSVPTPTNRQNRNLMPDRFATGIDYVPRDYFPAFLDKGEAVLTSREADDWRAGRSGGASMTFNITYYSRDLIDRAELEQAHRDMAGWMVQSMRSVRRTS